MEGIPRWAGEVFQAIVHLQISGAPLGGQHSRAVRKGVGEVLYPVHLSHMSPTPSPYTGPTGPAAHLERVSECPKGTPAHIQKQDQRLFKIL